MYKVKYKDNGKVDRFKARILSKGYSQYEELDYQETFSLMENMVIVRCVIALVVASKGKKLYQTYIYNAFLQGDLDEEVYIKMP